MVKVISTSSAGETMEFYMDGKLYSSLTKFVIPSLQLKDDDIVFVIDGPERCLSGDTIIRTNRAALGRKHSIKWMYNQFHNNPDKMPMFKQWNLKIPTYVRSYNGHFIQLHKINDVVYSGKQIVFRLELEDGKFIKCTANHKVMTNSGFIELYKLDMENDLVMCDTPNSKAVDKVKMDLHRDIQISLKFHPEYLKHKKRVKIQQLIYEAKLNDLSFHEFLEILMTDSVRAKSLKYVNTAKFCVHHKDFNHYNNNLENLELMKKEDHLKLHGQYQYANFSQGIPIFVKIKSIVEVGIEDTYDIVCDEPNHNFSANEMIIHNSGKSVFAQQLARAVDKDFSLDKICFTPDEFRAAIEKANKGDCIIFDEAYTGLSSKRALSEVNHLLVSLMMQMGQKNLIILIVMPTFFMLEKYVALFRARGLFHIYRKGVKKGYFLYFNAEKKKILFLAGQKMMSYKGCRANFRGRFLNKYVIDEAKYRKLKERALISSSLDKKENKLQDQRDRFVYMVWREWMKSRRNIERLCYIYGIDMKARQISTIVEGLYANLEPEAVERKRNLILELRRRQKIKENINKSMINMKDKMEKDIKVQIEELDNLDTDEILDEKGLEEQFLGGTGVVLPGLEHTTKVIQDTYKRSKDKLSDTPNNSNKGGLKNAKETA